MQRADEPDRGGCRSPTCPDFVPRTRQPWRRLKAPARSGEAAGCLCGTGISIRRAKFSNKKRMCAVIVCTAVRRREHGGTRRREIAGGWSYFQGAPAAAQAGAAQSGGDGANAPPFGLPSYFWDWCQDAGHIQANPCSLVSRAHRPKAPQARPPYVTPAERACPAWRSRWTAAEVGLARSC
jgi:hypothetical protein